MAVTNSEGKRFHSMSRMRNHEAMNPKKESSKAAPADDYPEKKEPETGSGADNMDAAGGDEQDVSDQDMDSVISEHGPAEKVETEKDEDGNVKVTSHHKGHKHVSKHGSHDEAAMQAKKAFGDDTDESNGQAGDSPEDENMREMSSSRGSIPGIG